MLSLQASHSNMSASIPANMRLEKNVRVTHLYKEYVLDVQVGQVISVSDDQDIELHGQAPEPRFCLGDVHVGQIEPYAMSHVFPTLKSDVRCDLEEED